MNDNTEYIIENDLKYAGGVLIFYIWLNNPYTCSQIEKVRSDNA